tara:strand:- start:376 stop:900 length:525 start_codon:yes stop_codon:yes gene_type:complete
MFPLSQQVGSQRLLLPEVAMVPQQQLTMEEAEVVVGGLPNQERVGQEIHPVRHHRRDTLVGIQIIAVQAGPAAAEREKSANQLQVQPGQDQSAMAAMADKVRSQVLQFIIAAGAGAEEIKQTNLMSGQVGKVAGQTLKTLNDQAIMERLILVGVVQEEIRVERGDHLVDRELLF